MLEKSFYLCSKHFGYYFSFELENKHLFNSIQFTRKRVMLKVLVERAEPSIPRFPLTKSPSISCLSFSIIDLVSRFAVEAFVCIFSKISQTFNVVLIPRSVRSNFARAWNDNVEGRVLINYQINSNLMYHGYGTPYLAI